MGHAGAIISGSSGTAAEKIAAFEAAGIGVAKRPVEFVELLRARLGGRKRAAAKPAPKKTAAKTAKKAAPKKKTSRR